MKLSLRLCMLLITILVVAPILGNQSQSMAITQPIPIQITDVMVPNEVAQGETGQVQAVVHNLANQSFQGFAKFTDDIGEITSHSPLDPFQNTLNFTVDPLSELEIVLDYSVAEEATLGSHSVTFEVSVGGFSFLLEQYEVQVISIATITSLIPSQVFQQGQVGYLLVSILNHIDQPVNVRLEAFGAKFVNNSQDVELSPGQNNIIIPILPNVTHVYDFGIFAVNLSMYYNDGLIDSHVALVPVDMALLNKVIAVILPVIIFLVLVIFYAFRKRQRLHRPTTSE